MLSSLITSHTRIKLIKKFFLNSNIKAYLRGLEAEFGESSNAIRIELNRFEKAGLLNSEREGNKKLFQANRNHPLYREIHNIVLKETGIDSIIQKVIYRLGQLDCVYLTGDFAKGKEGGMIELILVGKDIDSEYLDRKVRQAEEMIGRKINYVLMDNTEVQYNLKNYEPSDILPLWDCNGILTET